MRPRASVAARLSAGMVLIVGLACTAAAREVGITILHTTDLHGRLFPTRDDEGHDDMGGFLRCASLIRAVRSETPNLLLVDCGDLVQGSPESWPSRGRIMLSAIESLGYDAWVMGNHEWDWGIEHLARLRSASGVPMLAGNVRARPGGRYPLEGLRSFVIKEVDGVRVAVVGLTTPAMPTWFRPEFLGRAEFLSSVAALRELMPVVRQHVPDVLILAVHQGLRVFDNRANQVNALAKSFPEFDVILGGHTHGVVESRLLGDVLFTQAGCHGLALGRVDMTFDTVQKRVTVKTARVIPVASGLEPDAELVARIKGDLGRGDDFRRRAIGTAAVRIKAVSDVPGQSGVQQLICSAIARATGAEIVLQAAHNQESLDPGEITMSDMWRILPYEDRVGVARLTVSELQAILEENACEFGTSHFMGAHGLSYTLRPRAEKGRRVSDIRLADGSVPHPRRRLSVAMNSYVLASGGGRFPVTRAIVEQPTARLNLTDVDIRQAVIDYVRKHAPLRDRPFSGSVVVQGGR